MIHHYVELDHPQLARIWEKRQRGGGKRQLLIRAETFLDGEVAKDSAILLRIVAAFAGSKLSYQDHTENLTIYERRS